MEKHKSSKSSELPVGIPDREKRKPFKVFSDGNLNCKKFKVFPFAQQLKCPVIVFFRGTHQVSRIAGHIMCPAIPRDTTSVPHCGTHHVFRETAGHMDCPAVILLRDT